ncbi:MAG: PorT family protein [Balneola sp.]
MEHIVFIEVIKSDTKELINYTMKAFTKFATILSVITLTIGFSTKAQAQVLPEFGVKGGLNYSTFNDTDNVEYKPGFLIGAYADFNIPASPMSVQPEVLFAQYGAKAEDSDIEFDVNYIQIPVLLKFGFDTPAASPSVYFGPYMSFNTKAEVKNNDGSINLEDNVKDTSYGVVVGAGVDISKIRLGLRYTAGLTNLANDNFNDSAKNGALALTVGIGF